MLARQLASLATADFKRFFLICKKRTLHGRKSRFYLGLFKNFIWHLKSYIQSTYAPFFSNNVIFYRHVGRLVI